MEVVTLVSFLVEVNERLKHIEAMLQEKAQPTFTNSFAAREVLSKQERYVLDQRLQEHTYAQIGRDLEINAQRVRTIYYRGCRKLWGAYHRLPVAIRNVQPEIQKYGRLLHLDEVA